MNVPRPRPAERSGRRLVAAATALAVIVAFLGVGLALVVSGAVFGVGVTLVGYGVGGVGRSALQAPAVVAALGAELIAAALLIGWRVGGRIPVEEGDGHGPVVG